MDDSTYSKREIDKAEKKMKERETLAWAFAHFRGVFWLLAVAAIGQTLHSGLVVFSAFCSRDLIDAAVAGSNRQCILAGLVLLMTIFGLISVALFNAAIQERARARATIALQRRVFSVLLLRDYAATTKRHTGDSLNRLTSDVKIVANGLATIIPELVAFTTKLAFAFTALCYLNLTLAAIFFILGLFVFACALVFRRKLKTLHKAMQEAEGKARAFWQEILGSLFVVKVFAREQETTERSDALLNAHYRAMMKRRNYGMKLGCAVHALFAFGYFGALVWQSYLILNGAATFGATVAVLQLVGSVQGPFAGLSGLLPKYYNAIASAERIRELESMPDEKGADVEALDGKRLYEELEAIVFERVSFSYKRGEQEVRVLNDASFELPKGKNVVAVGRSGIGKSTLFKLLTGICAPDSGRIYLRTKNGDVPIDRRTRALFSLVPQGNMLFSGTIEDNIAFFKETRDPEAIRTAALLARATFIEQLDDSFQTTIGERGVGVSEGQAQRIAIARCAFERAPIELLDEATSALDQDTEQGVLRNFMEREDKTTIIISHRPAAFKFADLILTIDDNGKVAIDATKQV